MPAPEKLPLPELLACLRSGMSIGEIAARYHVSRQSVHQKCSHFGLAKNLHTTTPARCANPECRAWFTPKARAQHYCSRACRKKEEPCEDNL